MWLIIAPYLLEHFGLRFNMMVQNASGCTACHPGGNVREEHVACPVRTAALYVSLVRGACVDIVHALILKVELQEIVFSSYFVQVFDETLHIGFGLRDRSLALDSPCASQ